MNKSIENKLSIGGCYKVKDLYLFKGFDTKTGHLSWAEETTHKFYYSICLDVITINFRTVLVLLVEEGIRYANACSFLRCASLDSPSNHS